MVVKMQNSAGRAVYSSVRKRKRNLSLYYTIVLLVVLTAFAVLSTTIFFNIEEIVIKGNSIYSTDEIIAASGIKGGDNLIRTNMSKCCGTIETTLTYIEKAEAKRVFPSTVEITVTACTETANVQCEDGYYIISGSGKLLEISEKPRSKLLTITGVTPAETTVIGKRLECESENKTEILYKLIEIYKTALDQKIISFDMSDYLNISCLYDNRITIEFGTMSEMDYKLKLAYDILNNKIGETTEGTLTMLSTGASFIDKDGLEQNEETYQSNLLTSVETENSDGSDTDGSSESTEETTSAKINFE